MKPLLNRVLRGTPYRLVMWLTCFFIMAGNTVGMVYYAKHWERQPPLKVYYIQLPGSVDSPVVEQRSPYRSESDAGYGKGAEKTVSLVRLAEGD